MFGFKSLVIISLATAALSVAHKPFEGLGNLHVEVSALAGDQVESVDDLRFSATVTNNGVDSVKVLRYGTILDNQLPTQSFVVTKNGQPVPFTGVKLHLALTNLSETAFTTISSGQSITVNHEVSSLFDFATAGLGNFTFEALSNFLVTNATVDVTDVNPFLSSVTATANVVQVEVTHDVANRAHPAGNRRATDVCTNGAKKAQIDASYREGKNIARTAAAYISSKGVNDALYKSYFGANPKESVTKAFSAVANENNSARTLSCVDEFGICESGTVVAYTYVNGNNNIYYCDVFFSGKYKPTGDLCKGETVDLRDARGAVTLHELTHAVAKTIDYTYGCGTNDQGLNDVQKLLNADNYNCFATQVFRNTKC